MSCAIGVTARGRPILAGTTPNATARPPTVRRSHAGSHANPWALACKCSSRRPPLPTEGAPIPCWQSCWTAIGDKSSSGDADEAASSRFVTPAIGGKSSSGDAPPAKHCTASCPTKPQPAAAWRAAWDVQLAAFVRDHTEGREWRETMAFVGKPLPKETFVFNVY